MSVILGIDIGGSTTKIVGLRRDGSTIAMHRVQAQDPITSLYGALGNFLFTNSLSLADVSRIALTGVGASYVDGDIYGIPTEKVEEFTAVGVGGLALSGQEKAVVVSMGTGTAFIWAERGKEVRHLCGSGVGGGTLAGLCSRLCGTRQYDQIVKLAQEGDIYGIPTEKVEEFTAVGVGGLALSGQEKAVVVSMGTGTAFIWAEKGKEVRHLCGSGVGGGTLAGLCSRLCGTRQYDQIVKLAQEGDINHIDLTVGDITRNSHPSLPLDITAANFGNISDAATPGDFAAGAVNMVLQSIGTTAVMACRACGCETVVLTGFMSNLPQAEECFALFTRLHGIRFITPEHATFATSIGAALCSFRDGE